MKQNNRKKTWKAVVAVVMVMASLFAVSTVVSAGFVNEVFEEVCEMMTSSNVSQHEHTMDCYIRVVYYCEANGASCTLGKKGCSGGSCRTEYLERECGY